MEINKKIINPFTFYLSNNVLSIIKTIDEISKIKTDLKNVKSYFESHPKEHFKEINDLKLQLDYININIENLKKAFHYHHIESTQKMKCKKLTVLIDLN
jgi:hypothetical protein